MEPPERGGHWRITGARLNLLGHATPAVTLSIYAHAFAWAEHDERTREHMEAAFANVLT